MRPREVVVGASLDALWGSASCRWPTTRSPRTASTFDLTTTATDRDAEIDRLLALGATRAEVGQTGAESWTVLADPPFFHG